MWKFVDINQLKDKTIKIVRVETTWDRGRGENQVYLEILLDGKQAGLYAGSNEHSNDMLLLEVQT